MLIGAGSGQPARGDAPALKRVLRVRTKLADPSALLVVGCDGGVVIAMALAEPARQDFGAGLILPDAGHVSMVFVAPERWRQGIGTQLMDYLHDQMRARVWDRASLWTRASNQPARRLYTGRGYHQTADIKALDGRDEIVRYELRLCLRLTRCCRNPSRVPGSRRAPRAPEGWASTLQWEGIDWHLCGATSAHARPVRPATTGWI
jgi:ribosomal protein S18 acetylase RimI-like enzyme